MKITRTTATRRIPALIALAILLTLAAALSLIGAVPNAAPAAVSAAVPAQATVDYDSDNDNLIEISGHAQFHVIRYDLDGNGSPTSGAGATAYNTAFPNAASGMGCAATCIGYELTDDINLDTDGNGSWTTADTYWNGGAGWNPIGGFSTSERYTAVLNGNGFAITNLFISLASDTEPVGLFMFVGLGARVESLRVTTVGTGVTGNNNVGILAGYNVGEIVAVSTTGSVTASGSYAGGLFGQQTANGTIHSSYSNASVTGQANVGGLVGFASAGTSASITNSYSTGTVTRSSGTATTIGGLVGAIQTGFTASASYWDSATSGCTSGGTAGCTTSAAGTTQTTSALQTPVGYTGIYAAYNANIDGVTGADDPWYFGTTSQYPVLKYGKIDYDLDNDRYIEVSNLAQLDAIRHDFTGDGNPTNAAAYNAAFPLRFTAAGGRMGCPSAGCTGYELTANLDFDENGDGQITSADSTYWNGGAGWQPIASDTPYVAASRYQADFNGNGYTINNLFINRGNWDDVGLFGATHTTSRVESLGVTNANVRARNYVGILVGTSYGEIIACYTTGAVTGTGTGQSGNPGRVGGIVGHVGLDATAGIVSSSYSHASVDGYNAVGGLVGYGWNITLKNSYATGAITRTGLGSIALGGLLGWLRNGSVTTSYCDTDTGGRSRCGVRQGGGGAGLPVDGAIAQTTAELKTPTAYTGIYSTWTGYKNGVADDDLPWDFGASSDYPTLVYHIDDIDYDADNDNLIDISNLAQLDVIRYDRNGNGANEASGAYMVSVSDWANHTSAFPRRKAGMGCPATCGGYELVADLDFDSDGDGDVDANDHGGVFWDSGEGWNPIGAIGSSSAWRTTFRGNGHTINNLYINRPSTLNQAMFAHLWTEGRVESLGVTNADVTGGDRTAILARTNNGTIVGCYVTGKVTGGEYVGSLVARLERVVQSSYSTAQVSGTDKVGGLVGHINLASPRIYNSYSTGRVVRTSGTSTAIGGLVGALGGSASAANTVNSYWDTSTSGCVSGGSDGCTRSFGGAGKTTRELQTVTDFTGIYANWNTQPGNAWTFGNNMQYPMLTYQGMNTDPQGGQAMGMSDNGSIPVVGERVGVCLTPDDFPNRARVDGETYYVGWVWERSADGVDWSDAVPLDNMGMPSGDPPAYNNPPTYEYSPTTDDVGNYLRARMELSDGSTAYTRNLGGRVALPANSGATDGGTIPFVRNYVAPLVGFEIAVSNPIPEGATDARVGWQRCPNNSAPHTDCVYIPDVWWIPYAPTTDDIGSYLRMYVYYETSGGAWTRRVTPLTIGAVSAVP